MVLLHRYLMQPGPGQQVDHINRNKLDCRRSNLRLATPAQNSQNVPRVKGNAYETPYGRWQAKVKLAGKVFFLGTYQTKRKP